MTFILIRIIRAILTMVFVVTAVFFASRYSGNPIDIMFPEGLSPDEYAFWESYFGLDQSFFAQYVAYFKGLLEGNFGLSLTEFRPVTEIFAERLPNTIYLFGSAFLLAVAVGLPLGIYAAVERDKPISTAIMAVAFFGYAIPNYILAIFMILLFSFTLHWMPSSGNMTWVHFVMPTVTLAMAMMAWNIRFTRSAMLEVLNEDFIRTARAKGLREALVVNKHALRNAMIPIVSNLGLQVAGFVGWVVLVEAVFALEGIGSLIVRGALLRDFAILQFGVIVWAAVVIVANLIVDIIYAVLDPRVRIGA
ncbi:MAG: ABC transporter permease [Pseudomonadota bacterium]